MKKCGIYQFGAVLILLLLCITIGQTQTSKNNRLSLGAYAQIDYNQTIHSAFYSNGTLDVHRMVMTMGYKFNRRTKFFTEIEFEHVKEVYVEQAFLRYKINDYINFKGGLMLIPMGIINEYHEPNTFNGVERPNLDKIIVPTTWREIGAGFTGRIDDISLKYQVYIVNGFNGYNDKGLLNGSNGLRKGRQKGAKSYISSPNLSAKINYFGFGNLKLGLATYLGKSQSTLYHRLDKNDAKGLSIADSSVVGIKMFGIDAVYQIKGFSFKSQYIFTTVSNTEQYNAFTGNDLGSAFMGYYLEIAFNMLHSKNGVMALVPFIRYEKYNTHHKTDGPLVANNLLNKIELTMGVVWKLSRGAVLKADYQIINSKGSDQTQYQFNMGVGIAF